MKLLRAFSLIVVSSLMSALVASAGPVKVAVPGHPDEVTLIGIDEYEEPECAGVIAKAIATTNLAGAKVVADSKRPTDGVYVLLRSGQTLNAVAALTGCARLVGMGLDRDVELRSAVSSAQGLNRGHYAPKTLSAEARAEMEKQEVARDAAFYRRWSGSGSKDTESFDMPGGEWRVVWSAQPASAGGGLLSVNVHDASNGRIVSTVSSGQFSSEAQDNSVVRSSAGKFYLSISSVNASWHVAVAR